MRFPFFVGEVMDWPLECALQRAPERTYSYPDSIRLVSTRLRSRVELRHFVSDIKRLRFAHEAQFGNVDDTVLARRGKVTVVIRFFDLD